MIAPNMIKGKCFVITGALALGRRDTVYQLITEYGGQISNCVSKSIDYLVIGSLRRTHTIQPGKSRKIVQAEQYIVEGVPIKMISEKELVEMIWIRN